MQLLGLTLPVVLQNKLVMKNRYFSQKQNKTKKITLTEKENSVA